MLGLVHSTDGDWFAVLDVGEEREIVYEVSGGATVNAEECRDEIITMRGGGRDAQIPDLMMDR